MEYRAGIAGSFRLDACELYHLGPLRGCLDNAASEIGRRAAEHRPPQIGKPSLHFAVCENSGDLVIEAADDFRGRILAQAYGEPLARRVVRHKFADSWDIRQRFEACRGRHRQHAESSRPDVLDHQTETAEIDLHLATYQVTNRGPTPAIRDMRHVDVGHHLE